MWGVRRWHAAALFPDFVAAVQPRRAEVDEGDGIPVLFLGQQPSLSARSCIIADDARHARRPSPPAQDPKSVTHILAPLADRWHNGQG